MDYNNYYSQYPGYGAQYPQQQPQSQQYQAAPQIRNPFAPPPPPASTFAAHNANFDPDYEQQVAQWQAQYTPAAEQDRGKKGRNERDSANSAPPGQRAAGSGIAEGGEGKAKDGSKVTVVRKGGGESWEDQSLLEWDPKQFRIMVGNLAGEVTDESLAKAFDKFGVSKARVIRDKRTTKSKGYGFVAFTDAEQGFKAAREMVGKYIGSHPVTIQRAKTDVKPVVKKDNNKYKGKGKNNNQNKNKDNKGEKDVLRANTNAGIDKKTGKTASGLKLLG